MSIPQEDHFPAEIPQENWASLVEDYQTQIELPSTRPVHKGTTDPEKDPKLIKNNMSIKWKDRDRKDCVTSYLRDIHVRVQK